MSLFDRILVARGLTGKSKTSFLSPEYSNSHDPFLMNDMDKAVERLSNALDKQEHITIYGDYDIDGLTASALLKDAFTSFGFDNIDVFIPNRFSEGYGLTIDAIEEIAANGTHLIVTVDCGSNSIKEVKHAKKLNIDVIVTDHHSVGDKLPVSVAVINPKRRDSKYPFIDLAGVGVAFKLVQALQTKLIGLPVGQEKWLLDLVALGTVCDVVNLTDENRTNVFWGLKVLSHARRPGLKALMAISAIEPKLVDARSLAFRMGPRMNAAGRLETAKHAFDMLISEDPMVALEKVQYLDLLNKTRRIDQDKIIKQAIIQADNYINDSVLVVSGADWNHGIVGIVAAKLLEKYHKPTFVFQEMKDESKGSARSYGDFSAIQAIDNCRDIINKGGGHEFAAGVSLPTANINSFRSKVNKYYDSLGLINQPKLLLPKADTTAKLHEITKELVYQINTLEPFGRGNLQPVIKIDDLKVVSVSKMGSEKQHIKITLKDVSNNAMKFIAFNYPEFFNVNTNDIVSIWVSPSVNEWRGSIEVEGQLLHIEIVSSSR